MNTTSVSIVGRVFFPLDEQLVLNATVYSPGLAKQIVWLSALLPYEQCEAVFERIAGRSIPSSSIWRQGQFYGEKLWDYAQAQAEQVSVERIQFADARHDHRQKKGMSMDGGMVNIRQEGWRELKVGAVFDIEMRLERPQAQADLLEMAHGVNLHYTAVLGTKDEFSPMLWALAVKHELPTARERAIIADGALWIWNLAEDLCPDGRQIVDWFHALEHLHQAASAIYPQETDLRKRQQWLKTQTEALYMGRIHTLIQALDQAGQSQFSTYFDRHQRRMQYLEFREEGFPIGSGTVESAVKQFKQRLCATGMIWNAENAQRMLFLRASVLSNDFDQLWDAVA